LFETFLSEHATHTWIIRAPGNSATPSFGGPFLYIEPDSPDAQKIEDFHRMLYGVFVPWSFRDHPFQRDDTSWKPQFEQQQLAMSELVLRLVQNFGSWRKSEREVRAHEAMLNSQRQQDPDGHVQTEPIPTYWSSLLRRAKDLQVGGARASPLATAAIYSLVCEFLSWHHLLDRNIGNRTAQVMTRR